MYKFGVCSTPYLPWFSQSLAFEPTSARALNGLLRRHMLDTLSVLSAYIWIPSFGGNKPTITGKKNYQDPLRLKDRCLLSWPDLGKSTEKTLILWKTSVHLMQTHVSLKSDLQLAAGKLFPFVQQGRRWPFRDHSKPFTLKSSQWSQTKNNQT